MRLIREAAKAGADAVKFQAYRPEYLVAPDTPTYWSNPGSAKHQADYFQETATFSYETWERLADTAQEMGVEFLCTAFDEQLVDELDPLVARWKIASGDITHLGLVTRVASKGKPVILSTGASTIREIAQAVACIPSVPVTLLHCVLGYPTPPGQANLRAIRTLAHAFPSCAIGWSDHVPHDETVVAAFCCGASVIEKHFTLDRTADGPDHAHSWDPGTLADTKARLAVFDALLGTGEKIVQPCESGARRYARRSEHLIDGHPRMLRPAY